MTTAGLVLAAGLGTRFGAQKLLAPLDGRPILQHVLDLAATCRLEPVVVVLGRDADAVEAAIEWRDEARVRNPEPQRGLSSSVRLGLRELGGSSAARALVLLGDQPTLTAAQVEPLLSQPPDAARPIFVPRFDGRPGNPVLLERAAWPLSDQLSGDRGMGIVIEARPDLVRYIDLPGMSIDIDTPADLARVNPAAARAR